MKRYVLISDLQVPYHDHRATRAVIKFVREYQPDALFNVGDDIDSPETSRWAKGYALEYAGTLQAAFDQTRQVHSDFRDALGDKPYHVMRSNHGDRTQKYVRQYAPALDSLRSLDIDTLMGYSELGIRYHRQPFEMAPGWMLAHGDEGSMTRSAGGTALGLAKKWGRSVVCGHTHRLGVQNHTLAVNSRVVLDLSGFETGNLMDLSKAGYLKAGSGDWQSGFGLMYVEGQHVTVVPVPIKGGKFIVEGELYRT